MGKTVVAVDDEVQVREIVSTILEKNGYVALLAKNGEEAMDIIRQNSPDLIIMGILMPRQSGIKMYRELKSDEILNDIPIIIYSGIAKRTFLRTQAAREESGSQKSVPAPEEYVEKPATPEHLEKVIKKLLDE
jgi:twitching motility two-component system response regulator PilH